MSGLGRHLVNGTRFAPGRYVQGVWQEGPATPLAVMVSVQPARDKDLQTLPEGKRFDSMLKFYGADELFTADPETQRSGDQLAPFDPREVYEIVHVERWQNGLIPHFKSFGKRKSVLPAAQVGPVVASDNGIEA